jgi:hypothetical protein
MNGFYASVQAFADPVFAGFQGILTKESRAA